MEAFLKPKCSVNRFKRRKTAQPVRECPLSLHAKPMSSEVFLSVAPYPSSKIPIQALKIRWAFFIISQSAGNGFACSIAFLTIDALNPTSRCSVWYATRFGSLRVYKGKVMFS